MSDIIKDPILVSAIQCCYHYRRLNVINSLC
jgi:hypothetical protein